MREKLLDNWLSKLPTNTECHLSFESDRETLHLYRADYRKKKDAEFKEEMGDSKIWLISEVDGNFFIVDGSNEVIWVQG